ncbi:uncharacterized protein [Rutidosis leptorrhynchoides]|uniref:uncharacterized protein n=1 Tax=Rutidosis leptorrhynchoides TaxID=125765 RepID=UPI003A999FC2
MYRGYTHFSGACTKSYISGDTILVTIVSKCSNIIFALSGGMFSSVRLRLEEIAKKQAGEIWVYAHVYAMILGVKNRLKGRVLIYVIFELAHATYVWFNLGKIMPVTWADQYVLEVGRELLKETIQLQTGSRIYQLQGLRPSTWYEVKISYPASIPARFSLQLIKGDSDLLLKQNRKLLNTEKLIFKNADANIQNDQKSQTYVMLTVEPEGVVAIPRGKEREMVIYNIVCDELMLGIPHKARWVVILAVVCLGIAFVIPSFLPPLLIRSDQLQG